MVEEVNLTTPNGCLPWKFLTPLPWVPVRDAHDSLSAHANLSLSRLNHRLPGRQAHSEVVQGTTEFHHEITDPLLPETDPVFHAAAALHAAVDMLDPEPSTVQGLVGPLLLPGQLLSSWLLGRHEDFHVGQRKGQEAQILPLNLSSFVAA
jgi:hypothetical protein